ncbi:Adhesion G protein-coupled receptor E5 [Frankliniella fusca]|uniref:Adhesion G protein-coupled receptor E5 n=1 Tax=Frankliniella fusca TaxID=407009 RepID=A0AAE1HC62_9NEOP|nr:Adhesion G protein-coupled receptor E5 [Frankliniella fusca]
MFEFDPSKCTCQIELINEHYARRISAIDPFLLEDEHMLQLAQNSEMQQVDAANVPVATKVVKFSNLPKNFRENHFVAHLTQLGGKKLHLPRPIECAVKELNGEQQFCHIEFPDHATALKFVDFYPNIYQLKKLEADLVVVRQKVNAVRYLSSIVMLSSLPQPIFMDHLEDFLNDTALLYRLVANENVKAVVKLDIESPCTCKVEFADVDIALAIINIQPLVYEEKILELTPVVSKILNSPLVLMKNIPQGFRETRWKSFVNTQSFLLDISLPDVDDCVVSIKDYNPDKEQCIVEVISSNIAEAFVKAESLFCKGKEITGNPYA